MTNKYDFSNFDKFRLDLNPDGIIAFLFLGDIDVDTPAIEYNLSTKELVLCEIEFSFDVLEELKAYIEKRVVNYNQAIINSF